LMEGYGVWTIVKGDEARPDENVGATMTTILDISVGCFVWS
jgi:hypothetical protein